MDHVGSDGIHREDLLSVRRDPPWAVGTMAHLHAHVLFAFSEGGFRRLMAVFRYGSLVCGSVLGGRRTAGVGYGLCVHSVHDCEVSMSNRAPNSKNAAPKHANWQHANKRWDYGSWSCSRMAVILFVETTERPVLSSRKDEGCWQRQTRKKAPSVLRVNRRLRRWCTPV